MKQLTAAAIGALLSCTALGQDLLECLSPEIVDGLLAGGRDETRLTVSRDLPAELAEFSAPADFEFIGTAVRGEGVITTAAYATTQGTDTAHRALLAAFEAAGWEVEEEPGGGSTFNVPSRQTRSTICRDGERRQIQVEDIEGRRYARITIAAEQPPYACHADPLQQMVGPARFNRLRELMPSLDFPDTARAIGNGGGVGGSGDTVSTSTRIESTESASALGDLLASQLIGQGWMRDATWTGSLSTGSSWTREADGEPYWGTLEIVTIEPNVYDMRFMLMGRPL